MPLTKKEVNAKVVHIIQTKKIKDVIQELLKWQKQEPVEEIRQWIREPLLFVLENEHDWDNLLKCSAKWKIHKFDSAFYTRMKERLKEQPGAGLSVEQQRSDLPRLIQEYNKLHQPKEPSIENIEWYLGDVEKTDNSLKENQHSNSSSLSSKNNSMRPLFGGKSFAQEKSRLGRRFGGSVQQTMQSDTSGMSKASKRLSFGFTQTMQNASKNLLGLTQKYENPDQQTSKAEKLQVQHQVALEKNQEDNLINEAEDLPKVKTETLTTADGNIHKKEIKFETEHKRQGESKREEQKQQFQSLQKSITPVKPLLEQKRINFRKPNSDLDINSLDASMNEDGWGSSVEKSPDSFKDFSLRKYKKSKSKPVISSVNEEEELKMEIMAQESNSFSLPHQTDHQNLSKESSGRNSSLKQDEFEFQSRDPLSINSSRNLSLRSAHPPNQTKPALFSEEELKLLNLPTNQPRPRDFRRQIKEEYHLNALYNFESRIMPK